ncbi:amino acid transporter aATP11 [Angomonas deanei]|nr:amino acid transporter aATP11 [Angomonas deanei]|eukprot:EPY31390.1 amino acid transporter aATP11 [Angomonas deanei]
MSSSSIGAGIISIPSAFETSGMIMGVIYLVIIALLTVYSFTVLGIAAEKTGLRNYEQIIRTLMGSGADYWLAFCLWFMCFGGEISYVISLRDIITEFLTNSSSTSAYLKTKPGANVITSMVWLGFMLPLCLPKEINSLRYCSFFAILFIIFFVICMIIHSSMNGLKDGPNPEVEMFQTGNKAIIGLSIFIYCFVNQVNAMEIYGEMHRPSVKRLTMSAGVSMTLCFTLYFLAGFFGYMDFGPQVSVGSTMKLYNPIKEPLFGVSYVGIMFKVCVGFGLHMIPIRDAVYHFCGTNASRVSWFKNALVCTFFATAALICGLFIPRVDFVFGLVGGFAGAFIAFIFPAFGFIYTGNWSLRTVGVFHYFATYFLLICGVIGVVFGTISTIYGEVLRH